MGIRTILEDAIRKLNWAGSSRAGAFQQQEVPTEDIDPHKLDTLLQRRFGNDYEVHVCYSSLSQVGLQAPYCLHRYETPANRLVMCTSR